MSREATQELGGWKSTEEVERGYNKARSEEVVPEMRAALGPAGDRMEMERFVKEFDNIPALVKTGEVGLSYRAFARQGVAHFSCASDLLTPELVAPLCVNSSIPRAVSRGREAPFLERC